MNEDRATRYQRLRRQSSAGSVLLAGGWLAALLLSGSSLVVRDAAIGLAGGSAFLTAAMFVAVLVLLHEVLQLPFAYYQGVTLERRYGLLTQSTRHWWLDHVRVSALGCVALAAGGVLAWALLAWTPAWWWVVWAVVLTGAQVVMTHVAPVVLIPMVDACEPLGRGELVARLLALARRANTRVIGVFEWHVGARTKKANAALAGIGNTRRILVSDTLLADHSDDEIEVILAHELAHHVYHDIWTAIGVQAAIMLASAWVADVALVQAAAWMQLSSKSDVAALPVVALAGGLAVIALSPLAHAVSRAHERRADRYALEMTQNVTAFVSAMKRLGALNLADHRPSPLVEFAFYTHPPVGARIRAAQTWEAGGAPGRARASRQ
ncbi:MAG: M48 family metalloprotease [Vicinamibacterales bacterium]